VRVVAILNQKGGVGKTTTAVNLGAALALAGRRVLLIDIDPQANLTDHLGVDATARGTTVYDVLTDAAPVEDGVVATETERLYVLPADPDLAAAEQELATEIAREMRLKRALRALRADAFDWVLVDCPPSLGLLSLNAMAAADELIVTVQTEYFAMRGLGQIDQIVAMVREHVNPGLRLLGILPTLVSPVTRLAREVIEEIRGHYGELVLATRIRQNVRLAEAPGHQQHIFAYDPHSAGAEDYTALARELERRVAAPDVPPEDVRAPDADGEVDELLHVERTPDTDTPASASEADASTEPEADEVADVPPRPPVLQPVTPPTHDPRTSDGAGA